MNASPEARITPLKRGVCYWCILALLLVPAIGGAGIVWAVFKAFA